ncbi:MAG: NUMOD3 domain-containing DNA-binding protein [Nanoarchaeota archaeon]
MKSTERCINCQRFISKTKLHTCKPAWNKGTHLSEEHRQKIIENAKNNPNYGMRNKKVSEETKKKMSLSKKGWIMSEEHRKKISESLKKYMSSEEVRKKISERNKGYIPSEETRKKISEIRKGHTTSEETRLKISNAHKGKKFSEETRRKIGKANSIALKGRPNGRKGTHISEKHKLILKNVRANQIFPMKDTKIEVKIQEYLKIMGLEFFTHQYMKDIEHSYQCDILIPALNLVIECDGNFWHKYPIGKEIDHIRTKELIEKGFKVLRLWESEIEVLTLDDFKEKISEMNK